MVSVNPAIGLASPAPISERLWLSCSDLAARALACPFVSQLAAGKLRKLTFQHYIAQNAFYLAALAETYERAGTYIKDSEAKRLLWELREAVVLELGRYDGYANAWVIDLKDHPEPSEATKKYIDFLIRATSRAQNVALPSAFREGETVANRLKPLEVESCTYDEKSSRNGIELGDQSVDGFSDLLEKVERQATKVLDPKQQTNHRNLMDQRFSPKNCSAAKAVAALLPCMQLYAFLGRELSRGNDLEGHPYKDWITSHASAEFQAASAKMETILDSVCQQDDSLEALLPVYREAMLLELNFFAGQPALLPAAPH
ncbi:hypothetical protein KFL_000810120 [Klebsormidium nitens]|uniref:Thiaminase-2/PQQC domain-containing protein n=1 Tax=Klebsormidium nitens TaxID=105231 RepID=A0A1Y1HWX5_KLENI|nr:hypothetical protein KFL_000810120 [Klebsormidium nitens]|eukprot:GAQ81471.1 hypothetical protein KFL_000810120 [Klebsormidium nitens]